jgi:hypothetical protein
MTPVRRLTRRTEVPFAALGSRTIFRGTRRNCKAEKYSLYRNRRSYQLSREATSGLYYKTITIVIMTIVSDATIWSVTLMIVIMTRLAKARIVNYDCL